MGFWDGLKRYAKTAAVNLDMDTADSPVMFVDQALKDGKVVYEVADAPRLKGGELETAIGNTSKFLARHPLEVGGGAVGGLILNSMVGNPLGGAVDAVTGGMTNLKADAYPSTNYYPQATQVPALSKDVSISQANQAIPRLSAEDLDRQVSYFQRRIRTDLETLKVLEKERLQANV